MTKQSNTSMTTEFEYETKVLISEQNFLQLQNYYLPDYPIVLHNDFYLETSDNFFKNNNSALRIRRYPTYNELTYKIKSKLHSQENTIRLNDDIVETILETKTLNLADLNFAISAFDELTSLQIVNYFIERQEISYSGSVIFLDKTTFFVGTSDFEIECESTSKEKSQATLTNFLTTHHITTSEASSSKIARYFQKINQ